jgi:hypothetical protein
VPVSPTLRHWQLADLLREHRDRSGMTIEQAAERLREFSPRWSRSKLQRIEGRIYPPQPAEVAHLAAVYAISASEAEAMTEMARDARRKGWWQSTALPKAVHLLAGLEQAATTIREFQLVLLPGLLQTSEYTRAVVAATDPGASIEVAEGWVAARMIRQQIIKRDDPVRFQAVISEAALSFPIGGARVMRNQFEQLIELTDAQHLTIQVLPFAVGAHAGLEGSFKLLTLPGIEHDIGYVEGQMGGVYLESQDDIRRCTLRFSAVSTMALNPADSRRWLEEKLSEYR